MASNDQGNTSHSSSGDWGVVSAAANISCCSRVGGSILEHHLGKETYPFLDGMNEGQAQALQGRKKPVQFLKEITRQQPRSKPQRGLGQR